MDSTHPSGCGHISGVRGGGMVCLLDDSIYLYPSLPAVFPCKMFCKVEVLDMIFQPVCITSQFNYIMYIIKNEPPHSLIAMFLVYLKLNVY